MPIISNLITLPNGMPRYEKPSFCHNCGSIEIVLNTKLDDDSDYNTDRIKYGVWHCYACDAKVAAHKDGRPQGYMAPRNIRALRYEFHKIMSKLRAQCYEYTEITSYLQARLNIPSDHLHSAWLTAGELRVAIKAMEERARRPRKNRPYNEERKERQYLDDSFRYKVVRIKKKGKGRLDYTHRGHKKGAA